jgi:hypothetical protein
MERIRIADMSISNMFNLEFIYRILDLNLVAVFMIYYGSYNSETILLNTISNASYIGIVPITFSISPVTSLIHLFFTGTLIGLNR